MEETSLTKTANFIKTEKYLIIFFCLALFFFIIFLTNRLSNKTGPVYKNSIRPGDTTKNEVKSKLGEPEKTESSGEAETYTYPSINKFRKDQIMFSQDVVSIVKEQVIGSEKGKLADYLKQYGQEDSIVYGPLGSVAPGHFWGKNGVLLFANTGDGTIFEIWYFKPQTLEEFLTDNSSVSKIFEHVEEH